MRSLDKRESSAAVSGGLGWQLFAVGFRQLLERRLSSEATKNSVLPGKQALETSPAFCILVLLRVSGRGENKAQPRATREQAELVAGRREGEEEQWSPSVHPIPSWGVLEHPTHFIREVTPTSLPTKSLGTNKSLNGSHNASKKSEEWEYRNSFCPGAVQSTQDTLTMENVGVFLPDPPASVKG